MRNKVQAPQHRLNQSAERRDRHRSIPDPAQDTAGQRRTAENAGPLPRGTRPEDDRKNALSHRTEVGTGGCSGEEFEEEGCIDQTPIRNNVEK